MQSHFGASMTQSFTNKKELKFVITLGNGTFGSSSANQITLQGYRATVDIDKAGGMMMGTLRAHIYGVSQSDMNSCVTFPYQPQRLSQGVKFNTVQVFAIDGAQETLVFTGNIINAWGNYDAMPDVYLTIQAQSTAAAQLTPVAPSSFNGAASVPTVAAQLASAMGLTFENNGVASIVSNQYLPGTALDQLRAVTQAAGCWMYIDNGVCAITPAYQARNKPAPLISAQTGMIGYPTFDGFGVNFKSLFNPAVVFGGPVQIQSDIPQASGMRIVTSIAYELDSEKPNGRWFMRIRGTTGNLSISAPAQG